MRDRERLLLSRFLVQPLDGEGVNIGVKYTGLDAYPGCFALTNENDGYFVSRLKQNANPVITEEFREWGGRAIPLEGEKIHDVVDDLLRKYIDVEVEMEFKCGLYEGTRSLDTKRFRVIVRDEDADDYHLYITNLPREEFFPADIATLYRCRWELETLFRELKTQYELDEFDTSNLDVVEILLYGALLSLLVSRDLLDLVTEQVDDEIVFPPVRRAATFRSTLSSSFTNSVSTSTTRHRHCRSC